MLFEVFLKFEMPCYIIAGKLIVIIMKSWNFATCFDPCMVRSGMVFMFVRFTANRLLLLATAGGVQWTLK